MKTVDDVLSHFGILGMKWGKKKGRKGSTQTVRTVSRSADREFLDSHKDKKVSELSNEQITKITNRINLEKQYAQLTKKEMSAGKKFAVDMLQRIAKEQAEKFVRAKLEAFIASRTRVPGVGGR